MPQSGAVRIWRAWRWESPGLTPMLSPSDPISWTRKSEYGWKSVFPGTPVGGFGGVLNRDAVVSAPVETDGSTWQLAQPIWVKSGLPALMEIVSARSCASGPGGARNVMNVKKFAMSSCTSVWFVAHGPTASSVLTGQPVAAAKFGAVCR